MMNHQNPQAALKTAYLDFVRPIQDHKLLDGAALTSDNVQKYVNGMARKMIYNYNMSCLSDYRKTHTAEDTFNDNKESIDVLRLTMESMDSKIKEYNDHISNHHVRTFCRDGCALFSSRSINEIHDHLVNTAGSKTIPCGLTIDYTDEERNEFNQSYPNPNGDGQITFRLLETSIDYIRTASTLSNCVARTDTGYFERARKKTLYIVNMSDEVGETKACIELRPDGNNGWNCYQFYGPNNNQVEGKYADVANQWIKDKNIDTSHAGINFGRDDERIRQRQGATYNELSYDDVTGELITNNNADSIQQRRDMHFKNLYNNVLPTPDEEFNNVIVNTIAKMKNDSYSVERTYGAKAEPEAKEQATAAEARPAHDNEHDLFDDDEYDLFGDMVF